MKNWFYFLFFNAYWASLDLGQTRIPRQNANYYMTLMMLFICGGILLGLGGLRVINFNLTLPLLVGVGVILFIERIFLPKDIIERKSAEYEYIKSFSKRERLFLCFGPLIFAGVINVCGGFVFALYAQ